MLTVRTTLAYSNTPSPPRYATPNAFSGQRINDSTSPWKGACAWSCLRTALPWREDEPTPQFASPGTFGLSRAEQAGDALVRTR